MSSLQVEEPVHTSWSRFCTVNHQAMGSNYQLSNMKHLGRDSKPATSEVEGEHFNCNTTEPHHSPPPLIFVQNKIAIT